MNGSHTCCLLLQCKFQKMKGPGSWFILLKHTASFQQPDCPSWVLVFSTSSRGWVSKDKLALCLVSTQQSSFLSLAIARKFMQQYIVCNMCTCSGTVSSVLNRFTLPIRKSWNWLVPSIYFKVMKCWNSLSALDDRLLPQGCWCFNWF